MVDSRCGLHCTGCGWKESCGCGECAVIPCDKLYAYSYLDPEHGDKPQGARVEVCRHWAAEDGKHAWKNVLLTSAGFEDFDGKQKANIAGCFLQMIDKPIHEAKVLFVPAAAIDDAAKEMAVWCKQELLRIGVSEENLRTYDLDGTITEEEAMLFDAVYFTGGSTSHLLHRIKKTGFAAIIKKMVHANKVYVGVSAGSMIATPNIGEPYDETTAGLCLINAYLSVHCPDDQQARTDLPLPHIPLTDNQAIAVRWDGYEIIAG